MGGEHSQKISKKENIFFFWQIRRRSSKLQTLTLSELSLSLNFIKINMCKNEQQKDRARIQYWATKQRNKDQNNPRDNKSLPERNAH